MTKFIEQRVEVLENEVAELKLIVHELRERPQFTTVINNSMQGPSTTNTVEDIIEFEGQQYRKVDRVAREGDVVIFTVSNVHYRSKKSYKVIENVKFTDENGQVIHVYNEHKRTPENVDVYELIEEGLNPQIPIVDETIEPLTPNQQRAEIIEKAKAFVKNIVGEYDTFNTTVGRYKDQSVRPIFHVNEKKRAITVLIYGAFGNQLIFKGITKCNPNDVFNEHIGKAIALGRALGLDVSEFEQAVQPTIAVGQLVESSVPEIYKVFTLEGIMGNVKYKAKNGSWQNAEGGDLPNESWYKIINDTNAIYEVK
ncbi:hypothetical protein [Lysinibacillus fusiformis]|uniref:hypothetical protein n=1 Tax=Lysinibacillus fusiformis TaxID=28031 RepID=UPI0035C1DB74|nr:hypothetical protein QYY55_16075 [Lysinibacillus fusiformis]